MNSNEIHFVVDEELVKLEEILKEIQFRLENPGLEMNKLILESFIMACAKAAKKPEKSEIPIPAILPKKPEKEIIKEIPKKKKVFPVPVPGGDHLKEFRAKIKPLERKLPKGQVLLIQDKFTKKPLAIAELNDKYIIREPGISENEIRVLKKVIKRKPENPEQAWKLLKKTGLPETKLTSVKYYLINALFALGRLEPLLHDKEIIGIQCDGVGKYLLIRRAGKLFKTNIIFRDKEDLDSYLKKLAGKLDKTLDEKHPTIDAVYRDFRFQITLGLHGASSKFIIKKVEK